MVGFLRRIFKQKSIANSKTPYKSVALSTGVVVDHYRNGRVEVNY